MTPNWKVGGWQSSAAYLYLLTLPDALLAWEYLRRNDAYRHRWASPATDDTIAFWGLAVPEDPTRDARDVQPVWDLRHCSDVRLTADDGDAALRFDLWHSGRRRTLLHDGSRLLLSDASRRDSLRPLVLDASLQVGSPFAYVVPSGLSSAISVRLLQNAIDAVHARPVAIEPCRPSRAALVHMRSLQALDGVATGASHRAIAAVLFGEARVAERWAPDSELRAQLRHLIRRARVLRDGGYRRLVALEPVAGREIPLR